MTPAAKPSGTLYLVATPIGNLEDITFRALRVLKDADVIACEDTRHTQQLLNFYSITTPTVSYHEHNELTRAPELVLQLEEGGNIALVSDAGMPVISDPGYRLVQLAIRHEVPVVPVPGASAFVAALSAAGLPVDKFRFLGFLPAKKSQRRKAIEELKAPSKTLVFYEAPHRLLDMLEDVRDILGNPPVVVAREVTKVHEEFSRGTASEVLARFKKKAPRGEITVLVAPQLANRSAARNNGSIREDVSRLMSAEGLDERAALKSVARNRGMSRSDAYRQWQAEKSSGK